ncbi:MAG TPA: hypothetical protein VKR80_07440 [Candidatus Limnocylindria bacterium]|nr:hypothetical protein [Candidatus Limnocylindria bacterium]
MSDPSDLSFWFGGPQYTPDPNAAKLGGNAQYAGQFATQGLYGGPQKATFDTSQQDQFRGQQQTLANQLAGVASGQQQGAGELAVQRQVGHAMAAQQSAAAGARGANAALGARDAMRNQADVGLAGAGQAQQAAIQDQAQARQLQAGVLDAARQGDLAAAHGQLQAMGMNQQQADQYLSLLTGMDQAEMQARLQQQAIQAGSYQPGMIGQAMSAAGGLMSGAGALGYKPGQG